MRLILIIEEDERQKVAVGRPRVSVVELRGKNAVVVDVPETPRPALLNLAGFSRASLNSRQENFLNLLSRRTVTNSEYRIFFKNKISTETARSDLMDLVAQGILSKKGTLKSTVYRVRENFLKHA